QTSLARGLVLLLAQTSEGATQQHDRPASIEHGFGRQLVARLELVLAFGGFNFNRDRRTRTSALQRLRSVALVRQEMSNRRAQKRAKASPQRIRVVEVVLFEHAREETLREILGVVDAVALAA